jgi:hypothetical protein
VKGSIVTRYPVEDAPLTHAVWQRLTPTERSVIAKIDADRLAWEREGMAPRFAAAMDEATYSTRNRFRLWETLIRQLENGFPPYGYMIDLYFNDLISRDNLDGIMSNHPVLAEGELGRLLTELDRRFDQATDFDGGAERHRWTSRFDDGQLSARWFRRPRELPWEH